MKLLSKLIPGGTGWTTFRSFLKNSVRSFENVIDVNRCYKAQSIDNCGKYDLVARGGGIAPFENVIPTWCNVIQFYYIDPTITSDDDNIGLNPRFCPCNWPNLRVDLNVRMLDFDQNEELLPRDFEMSCKEMYEAALIESFAYALHDSATIFCNVEEEGSKRNFFAMSTSFKQTTPTDVKKCCGFTYSNRSRTCSEKGGCGKALTTLSKLKEAQKDKQGLLFKLKRMRIPSTTFLHALTRDESGF